MELFAASPERNHQFSSDQNREMFGDALPGHAKVAAKLVQGLSIVLMKLIKQGSPAGIGQGFEDSVHGEEYATEWLHIEGNCASLPRLSDSVLKVQRTRPEIDDPVMGLQHFSSKKPSHLPRFSTRRL